MGCQGHAACFPLSRLRTSTSAGRVRLKSGVMPTLLSLQDGHDGKTQQSCFAGGCGG